MQEIKKDPLYLFIKDREDVTRNKLPPLNYSGEDDNPISFLDLAPERKTILVSWVLNTMAKSKSINKIVTSYGIKHLFDKSLNGFYIKNGVMKGAMLIADFKVNDMQQQNWCFNIRQSSINNMYRTAYEYPTRYDLEKNIKKVNKK